MLYMRTVCSIYLSFPSHEFYLIATLNLRLFVLCLLSTFTSSLPFLFLTLYRTLSPFLLIFRLQRSRLKEDREWADTSLLLQLQSSMIQPTYSVSALRILCHILLHHVLLYYDDKICLVVES